MSNLRKKVKIEKLIIQPEKLIPVIVLHVVEDHSLQVEMLEDQN